MGSRYIVIEVDDQEQAGTLVEQFRAWTRKGKKIRVVGLFARPGKTCTCSVAASRGYSNRNVKRGARFGWWVCDQCGKPRLGNHELKNILPPNEIESPRIEQGVDRLAQVPDEKPYFQYPLIMGIVAYPQAVAEADVA